MKNSFSIGVFCTWCFIVILCMHSSVMSSSLHSPLHRHITLSFKEKENAQSGREETGQKHQEGFGHKGEVGMRVYPAGSGLPDCSHACGPCFPCKRVMVSFRCSVAESCPVVYRCMCKGRYYHVPSNY